MRVVVIGAGFGGLGVAHALRQAGVTDVTILERADQVGGVWRDNTYPGAACDVPSPLYSWSWASNPDWGRRYSPQPEILDYIRRTAAEDGQALRVIDHGFQRHVNPRQPVLLHHHSTRRWYASR